jgi:hypothetical protein
MPSRSRTSTSLALALALVVMTLVALPVGAATPSAAGGASATAGQPDALAVTTTADSAVTVRLVPDDAAVAPDGTATVDVVIEGATAGVYGFELTVVATDTDVATIASATAAGDPVIERTPIAADNGSVRLQVGGVDLGGDGEPVTVASVTVAGEREGTAVLTVADGGTVAAPPDPNVTAYPVASRVGATIDVTETPAPTVPGGDGPATNVDSDPQLEDVDGDGEFTIFDVQTFLEAFDGSVVRSNAASFDFDGSADGEVTIFDVQALLEEL